MKKTSENKEEENIQKRDNTEEPRLLNLVGNIINRKIEEIDVAQVSINKEVPNKKKESSKKIEQEDTQNINKSVEKDKKDKTEINLNEKEKQFNNTHTNTNNMQINETEEKKNILNNKAAEDKSKNNPFNLNSMQIDDNKPYNPFEETKSENPKKENTKDEKEYTNSNEKKNCINETKMNINEEKEIKEIKNPIQEIEENENKLVNATNVMEKLTFQKVIKKIPPIISSNFFLCNTYINYSLCCNIIIKLKKIEISKNEIEDKLFLYLRDMNYLLTNTNVYDV